MRPADPPLVVVTVAIAAIQPDPVIAEHKTRLYADAVARHGARPHVIDATAGETERREAFAAMHGLLICGGADIHPSWYGQGVRGAVDLEPDRDALEAEGWAAAAERRRPVLGVCRGMQAINVFSGGTLVQHVDGHAGPAFGRGPAAVHAIRVEPDTRLAALVGAGEHAVNSYHHQGVRATDLAAGLRASAWADGPEGELVEALEVPDGRFVVGVQSHPERRESTPPAFERLFAGFVEACRA